MHYPALSRCEGARIAIDRCPTSYDSCRQSSVTWRDVGAPDSRIGRHQVRSVWIRAPNFHSNFNFFSLRVLLQLLKLAINQVLTQDHSISRIKGCGDTSLNDKVRFFRTEHRALVDFLIFFVFIRPATRNATNKIFTSSIFATLSNYFLPPISRHTTCWFEPVPRSLN